VDCIIGAQHDGQHVWVSCDCTLPDLAAKILVEPNGWLRKAVDGEGCGAQLVLKQQRPRHDGIAPRLCAAQGVTEDGDDRCAWREYIEKLLLRIAHAAGMLRAVEQLADVSGHIEEKKRKYAKVLFAMLKV
tara:strand:- start:44 stop:436 length:393 start_codon:yes stop_codon:yes gene_type:complete